MKPSEVQGFRRDIWRLALALAIVLAIAWAPYLFFGKTLLASAGDVPSLYPEGAALTHAVGMHVPRSLDAGAPAWQNEPWLALEHHLLFNEHILPMWDPYDGYGVPFAASMIAQPFYPLALAVSINPTPFTYDLLVIGRLYLVGLGSALFLRLFAGFIPALTAGICAAFSGYFLIYVDIVHIGVEVLLPWILIGVELVVRRADARSAALLGAAWAVSLLGGMPESSALASTVFGAYAVFRIVLTAADGRARRRVFWCFGGIVVGTAIAAIEVLPFIEYLGLDFDIHQQQPPGLGYDSFSPRLLLTEFTPLAFGPPLNLILHDFSGHTGLRGAPGVFAIFFATLGAITAAGSLARRQAKDQIALFLLAIGIAFEMKRFGNPIVEWLGLLPGLRLVDFAKYGEAVVAVCFALAAGFGVAAVLERRVRFWQLSSAIAIVLGVLSWLYRETTLPPSVPHPAFYYLALMLGLLVLAVCAVTAKMSLDARRINWVSRSLVAAGLFEACGAFLVPVYYVIDRPVSAARNPFAGAPFIEYLHQATAHDAGRIVASENVLFPDWASAFDLFDTRDLSAMYPGRYLRFINTFLGGVSAATGDRVNRFTGQIGIDYDDPLARRWLVLSSVKYVGSSKRLPPKIENGVLRDLWSQNQDAIGPDRTPTVHLTTAEIDGTTEAALFDHPPDSTIVFGTVPPRGFAWFDVDVALDPAVWNFGCGGAVSFSVDATDAAGAPIARAVRTIDPKHSVADRHWNRLTLDLRSAHGNPVRLHFATSVPPLADLCAAWALWGEPRWAATQNPPPLKSVLSAGLAIVPSIRDINLYRVEGTLPRLTIFHRIESVADGESALSALTAKSFDVRRTLVVEGAAPPVGPSAGADRIDVIERTSQRVEADVSTAENAVLLQNDTWYPGWSATIDGTPSPIVRADYLFRGIAVPAGHHRLIIEYRSRTVAIGAAVSIAGIVALTVMFIFTPALRRSLAVYSTRRARA